MATPQRKNHADFFVEGLLGLGLYFNLLQTQTLTMRLHDPAYPDVGTDFIRRTQNLGCREVMNVNYAINAAFTSFVYPPNAGQSGFVNRIEYGTPAFEMPGRFFAARTHELIHALQYRSAACLHTDPFNDATNLVLHPYDYLLRKERLEQDAYAKGAWLQSLAAKKIPAYTGVLDKAPVSVDEFIACMHSAATLDDAISSAATNAAEKLADWIDDGTQHPARDLWHMLALKEYESIIQKRLARGPVTFVRMTETDIHDIGASFGTNPFKDDMTLHLSPENQALYDALAAHPLIPARENLMTVTEGIEKEGLTKAAFIQKSLGHRGSAPAAAPPSAPQPPDL